MTRALVYAYGCGRPISGLEHAQAEYERCTQMWDALVKLEHTIERELLHRARRGRGGAEGRPAREGPAVMSDLHSMAEGLRALDEERDPPNLHRYAPQPAADDELGEALQDVHNTRELLELSRMRELSFEEQWERATGIPSRGPI